jgi:CRISPR/Cas system-associated exonuclease Cas4 (RecB family)
MKAYDTRALLEDLSQICIRFYLEEKDYAKSESFIEYINSATDEEASLYLALKADASKTIDEIEVTVLISVLNSDSKEKYNANMFEE